MFCFACLGVGCCPLLLLAPIRCCHFVVACLGVGCFRSFVAADLRGGGNWVIKLCVLRMGHDYLVCSGHVSCPCQEWDEASYVVAGIGNGRCHVLLLALDRDKASLMEMLLLCHVCAGLEVG